ncbi:MAG: NfeD family protein [Deltaproteobacteria bacterium]
MLLLIFMPLIMLILMFMPLIAIPIFWLLPLGQAIPLYTLGIVLSGLMFWFMWRSMKRPAVTGIEGLIGKDAKVISQSRSGNEVAYDVEVQGELWTAFSDDVLHVGETVTIAAMDRNRLIVRHKDTDTAKGKRRGSQSILSE